METLEEMETEDLARQLVELLDEATKIKDRVASLNAELANRALDQPGNMLLIDGVGAFHAKKSGAKKTWKKEDLRKAVYRLAVDGTTHLSPDGEITVAEPEQRVYAAFDEFFDVTPRKTPFKRFTPEQIDIEDFLDEEGGQWTIQVVR